MSDPVQRSIMCARDVLEDVHHLKFFIHLGVTKLY